MILIGLHYTLVLCHSFKGCALPPSLLFHALCPSPIQTHKVASTIFWRDNQKIAGLGREILYNIHPPSPTQLEKAMAPQSSTLAWRIPGMGEPGGLPSMGSHRVRHNWSDLAAAAAAFYMKQMSDELASYFQCFHEYKTIDRVQGKTLLLRDPFHRRECDSKSLTKLFW